MAKYIPDFLSRFVGKIKVSSNINDVEFASDQRICINFLFSELEVLAGVTKMPIFQFTYNFSRSPIKNVTLPENLQFTVFDYDNYFIPPINGIEKINNKSE